MNQSDFNNNESAQHNQNKHLFLRDRVPSNIMPKENKMNTVITSPSVRSPFNQSRWATRSQDESDIVSAKMRGGSHYNSQLSRH